MNEKLLMELSNLSEMSLEDVKCIMSETSNIDSLDENELKELFKNFDKVKEVELVFKKSALDMFDWLNDYYYAFDNIKNVIIDENYTGKCFYEGYIDNHPQVFQLPSGLYAFQFM